MPRICLKYCLPFQIFTKVSWMWTRHFSSLAAPLGRLGGDSIIWNVSETNSIRERCELFFCSGKGCLSGLSLWPWHLFSIPQQVSDHIWNSTYRATEMSRNDLHMFLFVLTESEEKSQLKSNFEKHIFKKEYQTKSQQIPLRFLDSLYFQRQENELEEEESSVSKDKSEDEGCSIVFINLLDFFVFFSFWSVLDFLMKSFGFPPNVFGFGGEQCLARQTWRWGLLDSFNPSAWFHKMKNCWNICCIS